MAIRFSCPECGAIAHIAEEYAGRVASCARCGTMMTVPYQTSTALAPAPSPAPSDGEILFIDDDRPSRWPRQIVWTLLGLIALGVIVALLLPVRESAREAARRMSCSNNLKQLALALHNYHDVHGCFPPAYIADENGRPMHSWRILILPYVESTPLYDMYKFDEPWDSPHNLTIAQQMPDYFRCPSAPRFDGMTNYVAVFGDPESEVPETMFTANRSLSFEDVTDGTANTILVVEVPWGVPWTMPDADLNFGEMTMRVNGGPGSIGSFHKKGAHAAMVDGSVEFLSDETLPKHLRSFLMPADRSQSSRIEF